STFTLAPPGDHAANTGPSPTIVASTPIVSTKEGSDKGDLVYVSTVPSSPAPTEPSSPILDNVESKSDGEAHKAVSGDKEADNAGPNVPSNSKPNASDKVNAGNDAADHPKSPNGDPWYVVTLSQHVGVFRGWTTIQPLVSGVSGFCVKKYASYNAALIAFIKADSLGMVQIRA
ncbi:hypothetical protein C0991_005816, partial [Blastosporella zonata]